MWHADFHVHTKYSFDSQSSLEEIIAACQARHIDCVAIADHGTTEGAMALKRVAPFNVIVAEEVLTPYGEIMGMFLRETVPSPNSVAETLARIRDQGGLVCIPHPYDRLRNGSALKDSVLDEILPDVDIIEVFNSRSLIPNVERRARELARTHGKAESAGSDAHIPGEIGNAYVEMAEFSDSAAMLAALRFGKIVGHKSNPLVRVAARISGRRKPKD